MLCVFSSHSFWTSSSLDVPAGVTQEEVHTLFFFFIHLFAVRALIFLARRIQPLLSLVDPEVEFCVLRACINVLIESVHKICRQNLSKIKLCDWPNKLTLLVDEF